MTTLKRILTQYFKHYWWHVLVVSGIFALQFGFFLRAPLFKDQTPYVLHFESGANAQHLYYLLAKEKHLSSHLNFKLLLKMSPYTHSLKAGVYQLTGRETPPEVLKKIFDGDVLTSELTIIPGMRFEDIANELDKAPYLERTPDLVVTMASLCGVNKQGLDGAFLPESYQYDAGSSDTRLLKRSCDALTKTLSAIWQEREKGLPYKTPEALLIAASIIEKETAIEEERDKVSAVIVNRLKKRMRLQMDPTVIYALGNKYQGVIYKKDLKVDNPYNTYRNYGLPPTPIAATSVASIYAAAHPAKVNYIYFVATGSGGHHFSVTLKKQNQAVKAYQALKEKRKKSESANDSS